MQHTITSAYNQRRTTLCRRTNFIGAGQAQNRTLKSSMHLVLWLCALTCTFALLLILYGEQ